MEELLINMAESKIYIRREAAMQKFYGVSRETKRVFRDIDLKMAIC